MSSALCLFKMPRTILCFLVCLRLAIGSLAEAEEGWSAWSDWSTCSRSCDGGVSYRKRTCLKYPTSCEGDAVRYAICETTPCLKGTDFYADQCAAFDSKLFDGVLHEWEPHPDKSNPCALQCRARNSSASNVKGSALIATLSPTVRDGTRCRPGTLDMCVNGECMRVGCDLQVGSDKRLDECGVCGGDGTTCKAARYQWLTNGPTPPCSVPCLPGTTDFVPTCRDTVTGERVSDLMCDSLTRPNAAADCNVQRCPTRWGYDEWGPCSQSCGGGRRSRAVYCEQLLYNNTVVKVPDEACNNPKPRDNEPCNSLHCPDWSVGEWSECSVSCGKGGTRQRSVYCRDARGFRCSPLLCGQNSKPVETEPCPRNDSSASRPCPEYPEVKPQDDGDEFDEDDYDIDDDSRLDAADGVFAEPLKSPPWNRIKPKVSPSRLLPTEPTFIVGEWGECSVSCGEGTRERSVHCKIFLEFSRTEAILPDKECPGTRPESSQRCVMPPCAMNRLLDEGSEMNDDDVVRVSHLRSFSVNRGHVEDKSNAEGSSPEPSSDGDSYGFDLVVTYSWTTNGFSPCSASCLGGVQETVIECVRDSDGTVVSPFLCSLDTRPDTLTRTCNDVPCPPRWNVSEFSPCSKLCGHGVQERQVECIHEVTRGALNTLVVDDSNCPQPPPSAARHCNSFDCPVAWEAGPWLKCSKKCGGGQKSREIYCKQILALGQILDRPLAHCSGSGPRPASRKHCNTRACSTKKKPRIRGNPKQNFVMDSPMRKVSLKVGGRATVFRGTTVKIKCSVKHYDRSMIKWRKNGSPIIPQIHKNAHVTEKGTLRLKRVSFDDSGLYTCVAGAVTETIKLEVIPEPMKKISSSEERLGKDRSKSTAYGNHYDRENSIEYWDSSSPKDSRWSEAGTPRTDIDRDRWSSGKMTNDVDRMDAAAVDPRTSGRLEDVDEEDSDIWHESSRRGHRLSSGNNEEGADSDDFQQDAHASIGDQGSVASSASKLTPQFHKMLATIQAIVVSLLQATAGGRFSLTEAAGLQGDEGQREKKPNNLEESFGFLDFVSELDREQAKASAAAAAGRVAKLPAGITGAKPPSIGSTPTTTTTTQAAPTLNLFEDEQVHGIRHQHDLHAHLRHRTTTVIPEDDDEDPVEPVMPASHDLKRKLPDAFGSITFTEPPARRAPYPNLDIFLQPSTEPTLSTTSLRIANATDYWRAAAKFIPRQPAPDHHWGKPNWLDPGVPRVSNFPLTPKQVQEAEWKNGYGSQVFSYPEKWPPSYSRTTAPWFMPYPTIPSTTTTASTTTTTTAATTSTTAEPVFPPEYEEAEFEWLITEWSHCTKTCGGRGYQVRGFACIVHLENATEVVDSEFCQQRGLSPPERIQLCGMPECPVWSTGPWIPCKEGECFTWNWSYQKRNVTCQLSNSTIVDDTLCDASRKPKTKKECYNDVCKGEWRVEEWSECNAECDDDGLKSRKLECVWHGTTSAAGSACKEELRPTTIRMCRGPPCPKKASAGCQDGSRYCSLVKRLKMCHLQEYQTKCCVSCFNQASARKAKGPAPPGSENDDELFLP